MKNYVDTPYNFSEIVPYVITDREQIVRKFYQAEKCFFYDACSFRKHAQMPDPIHFFQYIKKHSGILVITRCILMELASNSGILNPEYVEYIKKMKSAGIEVLLIYEEDVFHVMDICYSTNIMINRYLTWAVRMVKHPTSTITETLKSNQALNDEVIKGHDVSDGLLYQRFFSAVRANKQEADNLGEEMIALCLHILSNIISEEDGKFCVITEDKGAIGMIDSVFRKTNEQFKGKKIIIYSTPKLVQHMYAERILTQVQDIEMMLSAGVAGDKLAILGTDVYDINNRVISIECSELAKKIAAPNGVHIVC